MAQIMNTYFCISGIDIFIESESIICERFSQIKREMDTQAWL